MIQLRKNLFETNSSSSHCLVINTLDTDYDYTGLDLTDDGVLTLHGGEFGWEINSFSDTATKLAYIVTYCAFYSRYQPELEEFLLKETKAKKIVWDVGENTYIDHQSLHICGFFTTPDTVHNNFLLKQFIFGKKSTLFTGNDNSTPNNMTAYIESQEGDVSFGDWIDE